MKHRARKGILLIAIAAIVAFGAVVAWRWAPPSSAAEMGPRTLVLIVEPSGEPLQPPATTGKPLTREIRPAVEAVTATAADGIQTSRE